MDNDSHRFEEISTEEALESTIIRLLEAAHKNDVPVTGSWEVRNGDKIPDWEVLVVELAKEHSD